MTVNDLQRSPETHNDYMKTKLNNEASDQIIFLIASLIFL